MSNYIKVTGNDIFSFNSRYSLLILEPWMAIFLTQKFFSSDHQMIELRQNFDPDKHWPAV